MPANEPVPATPPPVTTVVFDLGGVLIDWNPRRLYRRLFDGDEAAMEAFLRDVCNDPWNAEQDRGRSLAEATAELLSRHPGRRLHVEAYYSRWPEMLGGPIAGTVALLEALAARGVPLLALSNWSAETFPHVRGDPTYGFLDRFDRIFLSGELGLVKPDPAIFEHLLRETGLDAGRCLFVDDNAANVRTADALGFRAHLFASPADLGVELAALGLLGGEAGPTRP